jgi:hypothetical protein
MKKIFLTLTLISAIGMLLFFGCSKESEQKDTEQQKVFQPSEQDLLIEGKILAFKQKLDYVRENPNLKSGEEDMPVEEAVWNIEALVNYTYADASADFNTIVNDSVSITINLVDGKVAISDLTAAYDQIVDSLTEKYNQIQSEDKQLMIADISLIESNGTSAVFTVNSGISEGNSNPGGWFGPTDYWFYGNLLGKCDIYYGQGDGSDAAEQLQRKVNIRKSLPIGHRYFIDIKNVFCEALEDQIIYEPNTPNVIECECCNLTNPNDPVPWNNINDKLLFFNHGYALGINNFHDCIPPDEMNFYLAGLEEVIYNIGYDCFSQQLSGKIFSSCNMDWGLLVAPEESWFFHTANIQYGVSVGSGIPPHEL